MRYRLPKRLRLLQGEQQQGDVPVKGFSIFTDLEGVPLPCVLLDACMVIPIYHKMLYGVCRGFIQLVLDDRETGPWTVGSAARERASKLCINERAVRLLEPIPGHFRKL
jgi:hypothetical protein